MYLSSHCTCSEDLRIYYRLDRSFAALVERIAGITTLLNLGAPIRRSGRTIRVPAAPGGH
jgi:hypothetical protein